MNNWILMIITQQMNTYTDFEQKIIQYESNILKQAFYNPEVFIFLDKKIEDGFFSNQFRTVIWKSFVFIIENNEILSKSTIEDVFINSGNKLQIDNFWELITLKYDDEGQWKYHYRFLYEIFTKGKILKLLNETKENMTNRSANQIIDDIIDQLILYDIREEPSYTLKESFKKAIVEIIDRKEGRIVPFIRTGYDQFDILFKLDFNKIILLAAAKKIGKTKFIINLIMEILEIDPSISIKFYSFELSEKELIYEIISRDVNITSDEIQSKGYILTNQNIIDIRTSAKRFDNLDFDINTKPTTISKIKQDFIKFCKIRNTNRCILIIDNIGLLTDALSSQTETDDHIAKILVDIRDRTRALIFPVHHMLKSLESQDRLRKAYQPKTIHLKGSTRIGDYANMIILLHRPGFYEDLVQIETLRGLHKLKKGTFSRAKLIANIFIVDLVINRSGKTGIVRFLHRLKYCQFTEF